MSTFNNRRVSPHFGAPLVGLDSQPQLAFYISRTNGTLVPLIPADELPYHVRLQGIPTVLKPDQVFGLQHIATLPYTGATFKIEDLRTSLRTSIQPPEATHARSNSSTTDTQNIRPSDGLSMRPYTIHKMPTQGYDPPRSVPAYETATNWRKAAPQDPQSVIDSIVGMKPGEESAGKMAYIPRSQRPLPPSGKEPDQEKKEFCTHWIRYGECDYTQQGCLYKHEMPDRATLLKIGFRSVPKWWLEKSQSSMVEGGRATVERNVQPTVWLKSTSAEPADEQSSGDEDSDSESSGEESMRRMLNGETPRKKRAKKDVSMRRTDSAATHQSIAAPSSERKQSTTNNLIDFEPLVPAPRSSNTSNGSVSSSSTGSDYTSVKKPASPTPTYKSVTHELKKPKHKVFVPGGEEKEAHIAESKAKATRKRASLRTTKRSKEAHPSPGTPIRKERHESGLMASMHAPSHLEDSPNRASKKGHRHRQVESSHAGFGPGRGAKENA